jgi:predicted SAM-dependent methyltransferase
LQLGTSRLELLEPQVLQFFLDKTWLHLGDTAAPELGGALRRVGRFLNRARAQGVLPVLRDGIRAVRRRRQWARQPCSTEEVYGRTHFRDFYFRKGEGLPFADASFAFIYSEHFFEHLFFDEALALLKECHRLLRPNGVLRTIVPDADLRTYERPEVAGFPGPHLPVNHPDKHKTRWSVYLLGEALQVAGFETVPLRFCDRDGRYVRRHPAEVRDAYGPGVDEKVVFELGYVRRLDSLIVDGIKRGSAPGPHA